MIIVGKKYVIVNSYAGNDGKIVTVTGCAGFVLGFNHASGCRWYLDCEVMSTRGRMITHVAEKQLKPINEDDGRKVISWEEMKDIWTPKKVCA